MGGEAGTGSEVSWDYCDPEYLPTIANDTANRGSCFPRPEPCYRALTVQPSVHH